MTSGSASDRFSSSPDRHRDFAFPWFAREARHQCIKDVPRGSFAVPPDVRCDQRLDVSAESRVRQLLEEVRLEHGAAHTLTVVLEVPTEARHHAVRVDYRSPAGKPQIEEVAAQCARCRGQDLPR